MCCHQFKIAKELLLTRTELELRLRLSCKSLPRFGQQLKPENRNWTRRQGRGNLSPQLKWEVLFLCAPKVCPTWTGKQEVMRLQVFITLILHSAAHAAYTQYLQREHATRQSRRQILYAGNVFNSTYTRTQTQTYAYICLQLGTLRGVWAIFHNYSNCSGNLSSAMKLSASQLFLLGFFRGKPSELGRGRCRGRGYCNLLCHSI